MHQETSLPALSSAASPLSGTLKVPGDKSISHRALMLSSQVLGHTVIHGLLEGEDVLATAKALRQMGVNIRKNPEGTWEIDGVGVLGLHESPDVLDMENAGTGARLMMGLVTPYAFTTFFTGDASLRSRPMGRVITPLTQMGAECTAHEGGKLPLALKGTGHALPIEYTLPVASAQVKSAILLAGLGTQGTTSVIEKEASRDHTERMLKFLGFPVTTQSLPDGATRISITGNPPQIPEQRVITVPADPSSAAFPLVAALLTPGSDITLTAVCVNPLRIGLLTTLQDMVMDPSAIHIDQKREVNGEDIADIRVKYSRLRAVEVPAARVPSMIDEYPVLAVAAAFATGTTVMHGLAELRVKESDRLSAIIAGLAANGIRAWAEGDSLYVEGGTPAGGGTVTTHFDHRIAMSFLVMGMNAKAPVRVDDVTAIATSFPHFMEVMNSLGGAMKLAYAPVASPILVVAVDGPAASGKGTLARRIAEYFGYAYLDTGSLYRAVGLKLVYNHQDPEDPAAALAAARSIDAEDLANPRLRQERIGKAASVVSAMPSVRAALLQYQRDYAKRPEGAVLDGRDIGTVVCPDAQVKIFITADLETRAKRRHREIEGEGFKVDYVSVLEELKKRDERDETRAAAPLKPAADAITLDTSTLSAEDVFETVKTIIMDKHKTSK